MRIVFMGTPDFAVPALKSLLKAGHQIVGVVTQPDKPKGRGNKLTPSAVKVAAQEAGLQIYQPNKVKTPEFLETLNQLSPELIVVVAYGRILSKEILETPKYGCVNVHASLLPKYRGAAPIHWAVMNGEHKTGVTIMQMDEGLDSGDMILTGEISILPEDTTGTVHDKLADLGAQLLVEAVGLLEKGEAKRIPQSHDESTYAPMLDKKVELINWTKSSAEIFNHIRGLNPWPGAYTIFEGKVLKVWASNACTIDRIPGPIPELAQHKPGEILGRIPELGFAVATGNGCLAITEVQPQGSKRMKAEDFMNGHSLSKGSVLG